MHSWGDEGVDWKGITDAAYFIGTNLRKWFRVDVRDMKEKFGTVRVYCSFGWCQLHSVTHPGYHYSQYPKWLWTLDIYWLSKIVRLFNIVVVPFHKLMYRILYHRAVLKWPHLRKEILVAADHPELLKGI